MLYRTNREIIAFFFKELIFPFSLLSFFMKYYKSEKVSLNTTGQALSRICLCVGA